jgi:aminoglycoside phosphotransferase (APT) family kinase protein
VDSPTQRQLTIEDVDAATRRAFGVGSVYAEPMTGGSFGAVWKVTLPDGRDVVLKAAPKPGARLLRYEAGVLAAEAEYLRLVAARAPGVPAPRLLHEDDEFIFMTMLPGVPMYALPDDVDRDKLRFQLGAVIATLHGVRGDRFGYTTGGRAHGATWDVAFTGMIAELLADAEELGVPLRPGLMEVVRAHAERLNGVRVGVPLHFDLWDGNVLVDGGVSGIVDGERWLWGDPLLDFVSTALFQLEVDPSFAAGYRSVREIDLDSPSARTRLDLYRLHLYLVMLVEEPTRDLSPEDERHYAVEGLVNEITRRLG